MDIEDLQHSLEQLDKEGKKPRFIYTIPDFQNPSGITMSLERRKKLIKIAKEREIPIVEDSPYRELSFTGEVLPSLWTIAEGKGVICPNAHFGNWEVVCEWDGWWVNWT